LTLCRQLKRQNVEIVVVCLREQVKDSRSLREDFENEGIRVINLRTYSHCNLLFLGKVAQVLRLERPDILHTHLPRADLAGAIAKFFNPGLTWVCSAHAIYSVDWSGRWSLPLLDILWRRADVMLCISRAVQDWLVGRGLPTEKTWVVHYGIDTQKFSEPLNAKLREHWGLSDKTVIGSIGRLERGKNHECLIMALPKICKDVPNVVLLIAGHDPSGYGTILRRLIDELGLEERVRLVGFQSDVVSFLGALDVFAFASKSEGFGQVIVEAMASGKPVVASKIPPLTEIVVDGETGSLVECGDSSAFAVAITRLLNDPIECQAMGAQGRERVREYFTADRMTQETMRIYGQLVGHPPALRSIA
jgi:glycosyltransferase involved in cell wall biosynthesis